MRRHACKSVAGNWSRARVFSCSGAGCNWVPQRAKAGAARADARIAAIRVLGSVGDAAVAPKIAEALEDDVAAVRREAAKALGEMGR